MSVTADTPVPLVRRGLIGWFLNPYVQIAIGSLLVTISELLLKTGATAAPQIARLPSWLGIGALASAWTWLGILFYILSFVSWLYVLRRLPLGLAFALINAVHVLVPVGAWLFLHEHVSTRRWLGIVLILTGIVMVIGPATKAEEKL